MGANLNPCTSTTAQHTPSPIGFEPLRAAMSSLLMPLPWEMRHTSFSRYVAPVTQPDWGSVCQTAPSGETDMAYIVEACNTVPALLEQRDTLLSALRAVAGKLGSRPYGTGSYLPKPLRDQVFAALAKAQQGGAA